MIICLTRAEGFQARIADPSVKIIELNKPEGQDWSLYWRLYRLLRDLRPAIVHTRNLAALEMQVIAWLAGVRARVHGEHGRDVHDLDGSNRKYNLLRRAVRPLVKRYIAVSRDLAAWLQEAVSVPLGRIEQIYNGVDTERFAPALPGLVDGTPPGFVDASVVVGTVGRLVEVKDQLSLVRAFAKLVADPRFDGGTLRLLIVGEGPLRAGLEREIAALKLEDQVWLPGDREDIPELLRLMGVFVLPSLGEGISNTVLEAMASGLPLVATRVGGNPELIEDGVNGYLVPVGDVQALATAISRLLDDPAALRCAGEHSRARVIRDFNWQRTVDRYLGVYDQLLNKPAA